MPQDRQQPALFASRGAGRRAQRLLLIEDDAFIASCLADALGDMGHAVCAIGATEDEAVTAASALRPDMILLDGRLQVGTGAAALARIEASGAVAHVFMTGDPEGILALWPHAIVLLKPFTDAQLEEALARAFAAQEACE